MFDALVKLLAHNPAVREVAVLLAALGALAAGEWIRDRMRRAAE